VFLVTLQIDSNTDKLYICMILSPKRVYHRNIKCSKIIFLHLSFHPIRCNNKRNKFPPAELVSVISLIWQHVSISEGHLQVGSIECIKYDIYYSNKII